MEILYPTALWAGALACFGILGAHALRMRTERNYREMWGSATLSLFPAALFWLFVIGGEPEMLKRTLLLVPAGALIGACLFAYLGYVVSDFRTAKAQEGGLPKKGDILGGIGAGMPRSGEMPKAGDVLGGIGFGIPNNGPAQTISPAPAPPPASTGAPSSGGTSNYSIGEIRDNHGIIQQGPNNTVNLAPQPELRGLKEEKIQNTDGSYTHRYLVEWTAEFPGDWRVKAYSKSILGVAVPSDKFGWSGLRQDEGYAFATIGRPNGRYTIVVQTHSDDPVELKHELIR